MKLDFTPFSTLGMYHLNTTHLKGLGGGGAPITTKAVYRSRRYSQEDTIVEAETSDCQPKGTAASRYFVKLLEPRNPASRSTPGKRTSKLSQHLRSLPLPPNPTLAPQ